MNLFWAQAGLALAEGASTGGRADYVGGTVAALSIRAGGRVDTSGAETFVFIAGPGSVRVPYADVNLLEYGQQSGRRYVAALAVSPLLLLSKSRKHFLTIGFKDSGGKQQALVLQVHKSDIRGLLASMEARTGLKVVYTDDEARRSGE
jgi:hypothetical protein